MAHCWPLLNEKLALVEIVSSTATGEYALRSGPDKPIQILLVPPLFEEANRMRRIIVQVMQALAADDIGTRLPDLPGMGESIAPLAAVSMGDWRAALAAWAVDVPGFTVSASFRGGALIDDAAGCDAAWRCAPETGQRIIRDLARSSSVEDGEAVILAGNRISRALHAELATATPAPLKKLRTVRLLTDAATADGQIAGSPVWRRSEPGDDDALVAAITSDLATWAKQCAAS